MACQVCKRELAPFDKLTHSLLKPEISGTGGFSALKIRGKSLELAQLYLKVPADRRKIEEPCGIFF